MYSSVSPAYRHQTLPQKRINEHSFTYHLALLAGLVSLRNEVLAKVLGEILCDKSRLGDNERLQQSRCIDADYGRFAQGMDLFQFRVGELVFATLEDLEFVVHIALCEEPEDALRAGLF